MLTQLKKRIENRESLYELKKSMFDLKEEEKNLVYSYYHFFNGNFGAAALAFADAVDVLPTEDAISETNILYSSFGDFLCGMQIAECCDECAESAASCSCCGGGFMLICGAVICVTCMENTGMEGSCCWNFCEGIQDCVCGCVCESIPELICDCICGICD